MGRTGPARARLVGRRGRRSFASTVRGVVLLGSILGCTQGTTSGEPSPSQTPGASRAAGIALLEIEDFDEAPAPRLLLEAGLLSAAYVERLPWDRLSITAAGDGCLTRPVGYDRGAKEGTLALLSAPNTGACTTLPTFTTTVITLPDGYEQVRTVTVDGLPADPVDLTSFTRTAADGTRLLVGPPATAGDGALVSGQLIVTDGGCAGLRQDGREFTVVWPHGTEFDGNAGIDLPGVGPVGYGDRVDGGGGYYDAESAGDVSLQVAVGLCDTRGDYAGLWVAMGDVPAQR